MVLKKVVSFVAAAAVAAAMLSGCGSSTSSSGSGASSKASSQLDEVTLKVILPGEKSKTFDAMKPLIDQKTQSAINATMDVVIVSFADIAQKTQVMLAGGEPVDLMFDAPWMHMNQMISEGYYAELSDLIKQYGPNVQKNRPQEMWDANKFNGKIMGVPLGIYLQQPHSFEIRKDLREKLGMGPIKTYDDFYKYLYAVKEKWPDMYPLLPDGAYNNKQYAWVPFVMLDDSKTNIRFTQALNSSLMLYYKNNDGKVHNFLEEKDPEIYSEIKQARKLYLDKIINPDVLSITSTSDYFFKKGNAASINIRAIAELSDQNINDLKAMDASAECVTLADQTQGKFISSYLMDNFICIPSSSQNKERAMMLLDWANQEDNYDLISYGEKGKDWEPVGDKKYKKLNPDFGSYVATFAFNWNPVLEKKDSRYTDDQVKLLDNLGSADYFIKDVTAGFTFDAEPVKNEIAQYNAIEATYYSAIMNGVVDPDEGISKLKAQGGSLLKTIQVELQKQVDAYIAKNK